MSPTTLKDEKVYNVTIKDFRSMATKTREDLLNPKFAYSALNIRFDSELGTIQKRPTRALYGGMTTLGTDQIEMIDRYYKNSDSSKTLIIAYDTFLKTGNDSTGVFSNIKTGLTAGERWTTLTFKDLWYGINGTDTNQVYDGSNTENMGVPVPGSAPTVATGAAGVLSGNYQYKVTFEIDGYQEGNASAASSTVSPSSEKVDLSSIPTSTNTRTTARNLYRTQAGGSVFYFLARIADNSTTTYTDNTADGSLDTTITAPTDYGAPAAYKYMVLHKSRVFMFNNSSNKSRGIYSDIRSGTSYPDVFPAANYMDIIKDNGEEVTGAIEDNFGQLIVFKPSVVIRVNTDTDDPVGWSGFSNIMTINGLISPLSLQKTHVGVIYLTRFAEVKKRLMLWNGQQSIPIFEELEPILSGIPETRLTDVVSYYHGGKYQMAYTDPDSGSSYNDRVLVIDLINQTWSIDKKNVNCFVGFRAGTDIGELYTGSSDTTGFVHREESTVNEIVVRFKSEIDAGTLSTHCASAGTEAAPTIGFTGDLTELIADDIISGISTVISTLTATEETAGPTVSWISEVFDTDSTNFLKAFWNAMEGTYGDSFFWIRVGSTNAACLSATWQGPYSDPTGSDISGVTAKRFVQIKGQLYVDVDQFSDASNIYFYRGSGDYVFRVTFGLGTPIDESIDFLYESEWTDFSWLSPQLPRMRKRFRQVRVDFEREEASGTLSWQYYLDTDTTLVTKSYAFSTYATKNFFVYQFPYTSIAKRIKWRLSHSDDDEPLKITAVHFQFSPLPISDMTTF